MSFFFNVDVFRDKCARPGRSGWRLLSRVKWTRKMWGQEHERLQSRPSHDAPDLMSLEHGDDQHTHDSWNAASEHRAELQALATTEVARALDISACSTDFLLRYDARLYYIKSIVGAT